MGIGLTAGQIAAIAAATSAAAGIGGTIMSAQAQSNAASAVARQNWLTTQAQNQAFYERNAAAQRQTSAQQAVQDQALSDRMIASTQTQQAEQAALKRQQDILAAETQQQQAQTQQGDVAAQDLLARTNAEQLQGSQDRAKAQMMALLTGGGGDRPLGPQGTSPTDDPATTGATARRLAEAATNIRNYGSKVAQTASYAQPMQDVGQAITGNQIGIMPTAIAAKLLHSGSDTRLLPATVQYLGAQQQGGTMQDVISSRQQAGLNLAGLEYGNSVAASNLRQQDIDTLAGNQAAQAQENAKAQQSLGQLVSGIGNLGLYATGYYFGGPDWLHPKPGVNAFTVTNHGA